ncbi:aldehyde dehydrogenase [Parasphingorhabdus sp.]|uniref:aldehyde dehydrogenase family protein n=1 Tax=Parasphingorhabdus sp. TaxID=2709688 RepID=UPI0035946E41
MTNFDPFGRQVFRQAGYQSVDSQRSINVINPSTLEKEGQIACVPSDLIDALLDEARKAQVEWSAIPVKSRAAMLHKVARSIDETSPRQVCELLTREMGKPYPEAVGELANVAPIFQYYAELAKDAGGSVAGNMQPGNFQFKRYDPYGVSVHILPYNYPLLLLGFTVAASLAAGNAVVIKPSEISSLSTLAFMQHFTMLPAGLVTCITGDGSVGEYLVESPKTDIVAFTGSLETARKINIACAKQMKPCLIEAGGNDPIIVSDKADADFAAAAVNCAAFHLSGQICTSAERIFVVDAIHDKFVSRLASRAAKLRVGDGLGHAEIGPMANKAARDKVQRLVTQAVAQGAKIETGGRFPELPATGWFYEPTVLSAVTTDMDIMNGELFGPVAPVCRVANIEEAIAKANASKYGLGASIITTDLAEAMKAIEELQSGMVWVNNPMVDNEAMPFGGRKLSGLGRELGREGLEVFRQVKFVTLDPTQKPYDWWYPYDDSVFCK